MFSMLLISNYLKRVELAKGKINTSSSGAEFLVMTGDYTLNHPSHELKLNQKLSHRSIF